MNGSVPVLTALSQYGVIVYLCVTEHTVSEVHGKCALKARHTATQQTGWLPISALAVSTSYFGELTYLSRSRDVFSLARL